MALYGDYTGARKDRRQTQAWQTIDGSADQVTLPDLPALRERSRDLIRNAPLATGAINTVVTPSFRRNPADEFIKCGRLRQRNTFPAHNGTPPRMRIPPRVLRSIFFSR